MNKNNYKKKFKNSKLDKNFENDTKVPKKAFRLRTKSFFLTYPQLPNTIGNEKIVETALEHYKDVFKSPFEYFIAVELHQDGNPHLHVFLKFVKVHSIYSSRKLDLKLVEPAVEGVEGEATICHGKYESATSESKIIQYLLKDVVSNGQMHTNMKLPMVDDVYYSNTYEHLYAVMLKDGYASAVKELYERYPREATMKGGSICSNLLKASVYLKGEERLESRTEYNFNSFVGVPDIVLDWLESLANKPLILYGGSGFGKTALAKTLMNQLGKKYLIVSEINDLKHFAASDFNAIIFDDLDFTQMSRENIIHLVDSDEDRNIRILYGTALIPSKTSKIFTLNYIRSLPHSNDQAIKRRTIHCELTKPIHELSAKDTSQLVQDNVELHPVFSSSQYFSPRSSFALEGSAKIGASQTSNNINTLEAEISAKTEPLPPVKRKRGRPKGSKNKVKK